MKRGPAITLYHSFCLNFLFLSLFSGVELLLRAPFTKHIVQTLIQAQGASGPAMPATHCPVNHVALQPWQMPPVEYCCSHGFSVPALTLG